MTKLHPLIPLLLNAAMTTRLEVMPPIRSHGLNLPHFVLVFSMMFPMIGSFRASNTLAATMIAVIAASSASVRFFVIRTNVRRKFANRA